MVKIDKRRIVIYGAVITLLIFLYVFGPLKPAETVVTGYLNLAIGKLHNVSTGISGLYFKQTDRSDLMARLEAVENDNKELIKQNAELRSLEEENRVLREQLGFFIKNKLHYIMANVISRGDITDNSGQTETIMIDKGKLDGVSPGLVVTSSNGIVAGKIMEVKDRLSLAYLTNNTKCKLAATILNQNNTAGIAQGELGLTIKMGFIPQSVNIKKDDIVVTSGLEQAIPRGLAIGKVLSVNKENNELWQAATIEPLSNPDNLHVVSIIIP
jgi:rod shape-determining protein MreC